MVQAFLTANQVDPVRLVVVADAGMLSQDKLTALDEAGLSFNVGSKTSKAPYDLAEHTHFYGDAYTDGQVIETATPKNGTKDLGGRSKVKHRPLGPPNWPRVLASGVAVQRRAIHP